MNEKFTQPDNWDGSETEKVVTITNNGNYDELIRVAIFPRWVDENNEPWSGNVNDTYVQIKYNNTNDWKKCDDGYYYYAKLLRQNESTTQIIDSVSTNIPEKEKDAYKGKTLIVDVKVESVQPTQQAYRQAWRTTTTEIQNTLDSICK